MAAPGGKADQTAQDKRLKKSFAKKPINQKLSDSVSAWKQQNYEPSMLKGRQKFVVDLTIKLSDDCWLFNYYAVRFMQLTTNSSHFHHN